MKKNLKDILNEISYKDYQADPSNANKKINQSISTVSGQLIKIERIVNQNLKLKTELDLDQRKYWGSTRARLHKIGERLIKLSNNIKKF